MVFLTFPVGIVGSLMSIFIFSRRSLNHKTNTGFLFRILCTFTLIRILFQAVFKRWDSFFEYRIKFHFDSQLFIEYVILQVLSWTQALISFDRFIVVFRPIKGVRIMSKKWVLNLIILSLIFLILCVNSPYFIQVFIQVSWFFRLIRCLKAIMGVFLPYLFVLILDIMVFVRLRKAKSMTIGRRQSRKRSARFTINTILIDLIYLIFNFPSTVIEIFLAISINSLGSNSCVVYIIYQILRILPFVCSCFLFFIFIIFNRNFRFEFFSIDLLLKVKQLMFRNQ